MKTFIRRTALASIAILFLLGGTTAAFASTQQQLKLTLPYGSVTNLGSETITAGGGSVIYAYIDGLAVDAGSSLHYNIFATQNGPSTSGYGFIGFTGTAQGVPFSVTGTFEINDNVPTPLPAGMQGTLPYFLVSDNPNNIRLTFGGVPQPLTPGTAFSLTPSIQFGVESPYFNPFGGPIVLMSSDGAIVIAATYTEATILWSGSQVTGPVAGTLGSSPVTGTLSLTSQEFTNFVTGTVQDSGKITFSDMSPSSLDATGTYTGTSYIPQPTGATLDSFGGLINCSPALLPYTCTETGFQSKGSFSAGPITGSYTTSWTIPALYFTSSITGTVAQHENNGGFGGNGNSGQNGGSGFWGFLSFLW